MVTAQAPIRIIRANEYRRERWKNGLGWTREIVRAPDAPEWAWRLSIAEIEQDAVFSAFPCVERTLVLLSGNGLRLRFADGRVEELLQPHDSVRFSGDDAVGGELVDGRTTDFNLMWRRGVVDAQLWHRPLVGAMVLFVDPGETWVVHLVAGQARFADGASDALLEAGDTALLGAGLARSRAVIDGGGEVLLVKIAPLSSSG